MYKTIKFRNEVTIMNVQATTLANTGYGIGVLIALAVIILIILGIVLIIRRAFD